MNRRVLLVDDDAGIRQTFQHHLGKSGFEVTTVDSAERALAQLQEVDPAVVVTDVRMSGMSGIDLVKRIHESIPDLTVIVITAFQDMRTAIEAMRAGAFDFLVKPLDLDQIELVLERALRDRRAQQRVNQNAADDAEPYVLDALIGRDPRMIDIYKRIGALANTGTAVLIRGETGTGKELIARAIHFNSSRAREPFVAVNCTAVPEPLLESELFGHVRGAFTGAVNERRGRFELAGAGTIFLDEIGDVSPAFQAKLLRVLQEREFFPVGSERGRTTDARVIAATHRPLEEMLRDGRFREDLYYRLNVVELSVPPLRERREDIPLLVESLSRRIARDLHRNALVVTAPALKRLAEHDWPGNVRELENELIRAATLSPSGVIGAEDLVLRASTRPTGTLDADDPSLAAAIRRHIDSVLHRAGGNKRRAATLLGISRARLDRWLADPEELASEQGQHGSAT